jgi:hypothetical protein
MSTVLKIKLSDAAAREIAAGVRALAAAVAALTAPVKAALTATATSVPALATAMPPAAVAGTGTVPVLRELAPDDRAGLRRRAKIRRFLPVNRRWIANYLAENPEDADQYAEQLAAPDELLVAIIEADPGKDRPDDMGGCLWAHFNPALAAAEAAA